MPPHIRWAALAVLPLGVLPTTLFLAPGAPGGEGALELAPRVQDGVAPLAGWLDLPETWGMQRPELIVLEVGGSGRLRAELVRMDHPWPWRWSLPEEVPLGRWQVQLVQPEYSTFCRLEEAGLDEVLLRVPEPCDLTVRAVDRDTGEPVSLRSVRRAGVPTPHASPEGVTSFSFRTQVGASPLVLDSPTHAATEPGRVWALEEGTQEIVVEMRRACWISFEFLDDLAQVSVPLERCTVTSHGGEGELVSVEGARLAVSHPGSYRIEFPEVEGYERLEPVVLHVDEEGTSRWLSVVRR